LAYTLAKEPANSIEEYMKAKEVLEKRVGEGSGVRLSLGVL
jgi:hypothetical protein